MIIKTPAMRLSVVLALLTVNLLFLANLMGFVPDASESALELRKSLSESLALQFSATADQGEYQTIQSTLRAVVERNDNIRSAAVRTIDGKLLALAGEHLAHWKPPVDGKSTPTHVRVSVYRRGKKWAVAEIRFAPLWADTLSGGFTNSFAGLLVFIALSGLTCYFFVIKKTLRELDPSAVIPERVQKAFDVLQEGVLILDAKEQIVMANNSFAGLFGKTPRAMIGLKGSELGWLDCQSPEQVGQLPWFRVQQDDQEHKGASLSLMKNDGRKIKLAVTAAMVTDNAGNSRGTLVTFDDITQLEEKNFELSDMVEKLQVANEEIQVKSQELETLANYDPMTRCLNRRSLGIRFQALFAAATAEGAHLSCLMVDIDFFKAVNDNHGHAVGDEVIKGIADVMRSCTRDTDLVGRYGGEEFCVVLPGLSIDKAALIAERIRETVESGPVGGINITASQGVSSIKYDAADPDEMINQADQALYAAKENGRNRVVSWGEEYDALVGDGGDPEIVAQVPEPADAATVDTDQAQLERRVQELEGLLEKSAIELAHYKTSEISG